MELYGRMTVKEFRCGSVIAREALMKKVGGIVAMVAGAAGLAVAVIGTFLSAIVAVFATDDVGIAVLLIGIGTGILCIAIMVLGIMAIKTNEVVTGRRLYGYLLILCAIAASALGGRVWLSGLRHAMQRVENAQMWCAESPKRKQPSPGSPGGTRSANRTGHGR